MAQRLLLVAHAATRRTSELVFGDDAAVARPDLVEAVTGRVAGWAAGPEPACGETCRLLGGEPEVVAGLAGPDVGRWRGRTLLAVGSEQGVAVQEWLSDPYAAPHGGESLADLVQRVGACCDEQRWPEGRSVLVVTPLVARAAAVHALQVPPEAMFRLDVAPLGRVGLSRQGPGWRLQQLG